MAITMGLDGVAWQAPCAGFPFRSAAPAVAFVAASTDCQAMPGVTMTGSATRLQFVSHKATLWYMGPARQTGQFMRLRLCQSEYCSEIKSAFF